MLLKIDHVKRRNGYGQLYIIAIYRYSRFYSQSLMRTYICVCVLYTANVSHCSAAACVIYSSSNAIFHPLPPHGDTPTMSAHFHAK